MDAPDAPSPKTNPLRQAFRALVPHSLRAALHASIVAPTRWPGFLARQARRAGWRIRDAMSPPRQPGLFFWHLTRAPGRLLNALRTPAHHARKGAAYMRDPQFWLAPFRRRKRQTLDQPSFAHALARMQQHDLGIRSIINIGAGSGGDSAFVQRAWPEARTLLIEMDEKFEADYRQLKRDLPDLAWEICAAGPHDQIGRMQKSDLGGVGGAIDLDEDSAAGAPVQFKRIDTLVREHGLEGPFFLRFDTHGFELDVLAGAAETLRDTALIMMEVYNFKLKFTGDKNLTFDEMSLHMKSLGFRCIDICDPMHRPGDMALWQMHLFFIRADHPLWADSSYSKPGPAGNP
jgi:FkbM family methyltransferase